MRFVALDFETTGVVKGFPNVPWQLGIVSFADGRVDAASQREWFFNPGDRPFSPYAVGRYRECAETLAAAPTFAEALGEILPEVTGVPLVAHNAAAERTTLVKAAPLTSFGPWVDTLVLTRAAYPGFPDYALGSLVEAFGLRPELEAICPGRTWHDALYDACACALIGCHFMRRNLWSARGGFA